MKIRNKVCRRIVLEKTCIKAKRSTSLPRATCNDNSNNDSNAVIITITRKYIECK